MSEPHHKDQLIHALRVVNAEVETYFVGLEPEIFFAGSDEAWSPAHHLQHLTLSNKPVAMALGLPKMLLKIVSLGKDSSKQGGYSDLVHLYKQALAEGRAKATGRYAPKLQSQNKEQILQGFIQAGESVVRGLGQWQDVALDHYALPHPVLGQLSVREMMFFTLYHNRHHLEGVRRRLAQT